MIQNSAYGNLILDGESLLLQICLQSNQNPTSEIIDMDSNNNLAVRGFCYTYAKQDDDHQHDETTIREQEHETTDEEQWNWSKTTHNIQNQTDDDCITSLPDVSQPKDELTKEEIVETLEQAAETGVLADGTTLPTPTTAVDAAKKKEEGVPKRPMNSFLLFCSRHRSILSNYFNEENRSITEKLGIWWNGLTEEQKSPYQLLALKFRAKLLALNPNFQWGKRTPANSQASPITDDAGANTSLIVDQTVQMDVSDDAIITDECLKAAEALVSLRKSVEVAPLTTFKMADESNMGSLKDLCIGTGTQPSGGLAVPGQTWESRCNGSSQMMAPCNSGLSFGGLVQQTGEGASAPKATRSCRANRYNAIMSHMYPRTNKCSNKAPKAPRKQPRPASNCQSTIKNSDTADSNINKVTEAELIAELYSKVAELSPLSIDHFLSVLIEYRRKRKSSTSARNGKRSKTQQSKAAMPRADIPGDVLAEDVTVPSTPIGTTAQPASSAAIVSEALTVQPISTKLVGSHKRKFRKERITHNPQPEKVERQTILISLDKSDAKDDDIYHARTGYLLENLMEFH